MTLSLADFLVIAGIVVPAVGGIILYFRHRIDLVTDNHLAHIDKKIDDVGEKVDALSADVKLLVGRIEGWDLDARVTRLEQRQFVGWQNK
jgi:hypothetical protein